MKFGTPSFAAFSAKATSMGFSSHLDPADPILRASLEMSARGQRLGTCALGVTEKWEYEMFLWCSRSNEESSQFNSVLATNVALAAAVRLRSGAHPLHF